MCHITKIRDFAAEYGLPEPEFIEMPETFRVNLYRRDIEKGIEKNAEMNSTGTETGIETSTEVKNTSAETNTNTNTNTKAGTETTTDTEAGTEKAKTSTENKILAMIEENPRITIKEMAEKIGMSKNGKVYSIDKLRKKNIIYREGAQKNGKWVIRQ